MKGFTWLRAGATKAAAALIGAALIGFGIGWATFRLPEFACGPFNADRFALWLAGIGGCGAAIATFIAAKIALDAGNKAIANERQLRNQERTDTLRERIIRQKAIASIFVPALYTLCLNCEAWRIMLEEEDIDVYDTADMIRNFRLEVLDALISHIVEFTAHEATAFGLSYGNLKSLVANAYDVRRENNWSISRTQQQKAILVRVVRQLSINSYGAWRIFSDLSGMFAQANDPRTDAREYAINEIANIREQRPKAG